MKELLRIEHAEGDRDTGNVLRDFHMEISEGEILYIQGSDGSGIREVSAVLSGDMPLFSGEIYIEEERINGYNRIKAYKKHIFPISANKSMIDNLTVAENMEALQNRRTLMQPYSSKKMEKKVDEFLRQVGMQIPANSLGSFLCTEEEVLLSILKAKMHGARLVVLEVLNSVMEGSYAEKIGSFIEDICQEGISFIILSSAYSHFAEIATRIQFVYRGRDLKEWPHLDEEVVRLLKSQNPDSLTSLDKDIDQSRGTKDGAFLGIYDYGWENDKCIWDFLAEVRLFNPTFWEQNLNVPLPVKGISIYRDVLVIPKESGNLWFENLSIEDNLVMPIPQKIAGSRYGIVHRNRREHVVSRFYETFHINKKIKEMKDLDKVERKLFSIYRYEILRPATVFLENPYWGMDQDEITLIRNYLAGMQKRGSSIVCCAKSVDEMKEDCRIVVQTDNARNARMIQI